MPRLMMFVLAGISSEEDAKGPSVEAFEAMSRFIKDLADAGRAARS